MFRSFLIFIPLTSTHLLPGKAPGAELLHLTHFPRRLAMGSPGQAETPRAIQAPPHCHGALGRPLWVPQGTQSSSEQPSAISAQAEYLI